MAYCRDGIKMTIFGCVLLLLTLLLPNSSYSHNGAVAIAVPVEGIVVDGDLSDWPKGMREYEIELPESGVAPKDSVDYKGSFRIGYNEKENALYVAVEVQDESVVVRESKDTWDVMEEWNTQDGCEIYLKIGSLLGKYYIFGDYRGASQPFVLDDVVMGVQRGEGTHRYECRIKKTDWSLHSNQVLGVDVVVEDKDADGSFSWMAWGPEPGKVTSDKIGLVVLVSGTDIGTLKGKIKWEDMEEGLRLGKVRIQSLASEELWVEVKTDSQGVYEVDLPVGEYRVEAGYRDRSTESVEVQIEREKTTIVKKGVWFADPPLGAIIEIESGRTVKSGVGFRKGNWHNFNVSDGLQHSAVTKMMQDKNGNLWMATWSGVCRFDGIQFTGFTEDDGLPNKSVQAMLEDDEGNLWFGSLNGVLRYNGEHWVHYTTEDGLADNTVWAMYEDREGYIWFGTNAGLNRYDGTQFQTPISQANGSIFSIFEDHEGNLWFGTTEGISRYNGHEVRSYTIHKGFIRDRIINCMIEDRKNNMWIGTNKGASRYDGEVFTHYAGAAVQDIHEDRMGNIWFATDNGVSRFDGEKFEYFSPQDGLAHARVEGIEEDREGNIWFCTQGGGISRYDGNQLAFYTEDDGLGDNVVLSLLEDSKGFLWFGTEGGVSRFDGHQFRNFTTENGLVNNSVNSIEEDDEGRLWFGTERGVSRFDGKQFFNLATENRLAGDQISCVLKDRNDHMWFGTLKYGAIRYDGTQFIYFSTEVDLGQHNYILSLYEDREGNIWIGTDQGGLTRYDGKEYRTFTTSDGLAQNAAWSILEDTKGKLWIGTGGEGVSRYDGKNFYTFNPRNGFVLNSVRSMIEDSRGHIWFGGWGEGVTRYDNLVFQNILPTDGLPSGTVFDMLQDRNGNIWLATERGAVCYRPGKTPPLIHLKDVVTDRRNGPVNSISAPSSDQLIAIEFYGISFGTRLGQIVYVYRLQGYQEEWRQTKDTRVEYTDLPIGEYTFEVKAVDRDLNYSEESATVKVTVHPPYGQIALWSGLGLSLLGLVLASGYGIRRQRERNRAQNERLELQEKLNQELEEELQTAHDM